MFCPNCGKEIKEGSNFCPFCGFRLVSEGKIPDREVIKNVLTRRIEGIKNRDAKVIESLVLGEKYMKFDDWPPFELQGPEGLKNEAEALKALKEYDYEARAWNIEVFDDSATAAFIIKYRGQIRDLSFSVQSRVTVFLIKQEGEWKIVHEHWSRFPAPETVMKPRDEEKSVHSVNA
jgi:ketosteroid isomerase-like protein